MVAAGLVAALVLGVAGLAVRSLPELKRYLRMESM
jgi:hypothetical protein